MGLEDVSGVEEGEEDLVGEGRPLTPATVRSLSPLPKSGEGLFVNDVGNPASRREGRSMLRPYAQESL